MKVLSIVSLLFISLTIQGEITGFGRDFLTGLLTIVKGKDFTLDEACFGTEFDKDFENLQKALESRDIILTFGYLGKVINDIGLKCPASDLAKIRDDALAVGLLELTNRINKHKIEVLEMLKQEFIKGKITAYTIGEACGNLVNIWIYEKTQTKFLAFLIDEKSLDVLVPVEQFVDGFFEGVSSGPIDQNKCSKDISGVKNQIVDVVTQLIDAIKTHNVNKILESITKVIDLISKLKDSYTNCNFAKLADILSALATKSGIAKLGYAAITHLSETVSDIKQVDIGINEKDYASAGRGVGDLFKILLKYTTQ